MPSGSKNHDFEERLHRAKRNRACDTCRKRKARCDGYEMLDSRCTICVTGGVECTYFESSKSSTSQSYVRELEKRLSQIERLIRELSDPDSELSRSRKAKEKQDTITHPTAGQGLQFSPFARIPRVDTLGPLPEAEEYENDDFVTLYDTSRGLAAGYYEDDPPRLFGEGSISMPSQNLGGGDQRGGNPLNRRPEFWTVPSWMLPILKGPRVSVVFPEPSLMRHLLNTYFDIHNIILPILHRPTFERLLTDKLHERSESFGAVVLLMCAIACRYSDDPRVSHSIITSTSNTGWNLFNQVDRLRRTRPLRHQLYDAQIYALAACFLDGFSPPQGPWMMAGIGLRVLQGIGVHKRAFTSKQTVENEIWKRCFWALVTMDRWFSNLLGRPFAIQDEDFDTDLPSSCDDEYLEHPDPEQAFKQPPGVPSKMDYFVSMIQLNQVLAFSQRTLYSTRKSRLILGYVGNRWESHIVSALESALGKWADSVPPHLRWDLQKDQTNMTWLRQALALACCYYELKLIIHRKFITRPDPALSEPALAVCIEASKSCLAALGSIKDKMNGKIRCLPHTKPLFAAAAFLSLRFYHEKSIDRESEEYKAVKTAQEMLVEIGSRWTTARRLNNVLNAILTLSDSRYRGWQPAKDDLWDIQTGLLSFIDKYGRLSMKESQWCEEEEEEEVGTDSDGSISPENTHPPHLAPSIERSISGSSSVGPSSIYPLTESPGRIEATPFWTRLDTTPIDPVPVPSEGVELLEPAGPMAIRPGLIPGRSGGLGGPPPPDGRFFSNPLNLRAVLTGIGDGYMSPEYPSQLGNLSPLHPVYKDHRTMGGDAQTPGSNPPEVAAERLGPSLSVPPAVTQIHNDPGLGTEYGCRPSLPWSSSSVFSAELMAYDDLMRDIGTAQYLGTEMREPLPPPFAHPSMSANGDMGINGSGSSTDGYRWQGAPHHGTHEPAQTSPLFGHLYPGQPRYGADRVSAQQAYGSREGQWPTGSITDYNAWERLLSERIMMGQQVNQRL